MAFAPQFRPLNRSAYNREKSIAPFIAQSMELRRRSPNPNVRVDTMQFRTCMEGVEPSHILEKIVWHKEVEVEQRRQKLPLIDLQIRVRDAAPPQDFVAAIRGSKTNPAVIAEVKKASPSKGVFREDFDPVAIAQSYAANGAACLSILTDAEFFQGSFENLALVRKAVDLPLLCKDFVIYPYQIYLARAHGADAFLLIAAILSDQDLKYFLAIGQKLGMTALVEVHSIEELDRVLGLKDLRLVGINNRNLKTFEVSLDVTAQLIAHGGDRLKERQIPIVSESGMFAPKDLQSVARMGAGAVLVGESLIKQPDPGIALRDLTVGLDR
jgi:indole-3-glycerol phosphate synthase